MTANPDLSRGTGTPVVVLVPPAPAPALRPPAGSTAPAAPLAEVLDAYARQPDEIAGLVEAWLTTLPDTADTRRYARAVLHALGELHVALDTAAHLTRHPTSPADPADDVAVHLPGSVRPQLGGGRRA